MEEKELIVGTPSKKTRVKFIIVGVAVLALAFVIWAFNIGGSRVWHGGGGDYNSNLLDILSFNLPDSVLLSLVTYLGLLLLVIGVVLYISLANTTITITNKRVYGTAVWGKRVDLPFDSVSAVSTSRFFKGIAVATASGMIKFFAIENYEEIHKTVSELLIGRQNAGQSISQTTIKQEIQQSSADELAKYKDLCDKGVITQEEFDAKKKQLLGL